MNIKGRTTIQLLDKNKKVTHEVVEENLITKAVERIALLQGRDFIKGLRSHQHNIFHYHTYNIAPIATELFGGILLFENSLPESTDTIFPPTSAKPVGHAGAPYSGTNPHRGTYNAAESGPLMSGLNAIGYRHVWDFVTDRANATIGCVCLTSRLGGNTGWKSRGLSPMTNMPEVFDPDSQIDTYLLSSLNTSIKPFSTVNTGAGALVAPALHSDASRNTLLYINDRDADGYAYFFTNEATIAKSTFSSHLTLGLETVPVGLTTSNLTHIASTESVYLGRRTYVHFHPTTREFTVVRPISGTVIERKVYNEAGTATFTERVTLVGSSIDSWSNPIVPPFYYKGKYYVSISNANASSLGEFDQTGALLRTFDWPMLGTQCYVTYISALDRVELRGRYSSNAFSVLFDGETFNAFKSIDSSSTFVQPAESETFAGPGFYVGANDNFTGTGYKTGFYYKFQTNYLASINNLAAPVTKTLSDMMKITYDILYEE